MTKTGYSSPEDDRAPEGRGDFVYSVLRRVVASHDPRPCAVLIKDGKSIGVIPCDDEEEYEWLKARLSGTRPRS